jgi:hypothetical protein
MISQLNDQPFNIPLSLPQYDIREVDEEVAKALNPNRFDGRRSR